MHPFTSRYSLTGNRIRRCAVMVAERFAKPSNRNVVRVRIASSPLALFKSPYCRHGGGLVTAGQRNHAIGQCGRVVNASVLKTGCPSGLVGSKPTTGVLN